MRKIKSKSVMNRLCLMIILLLFLSNTFTIEYAISRQSWKKDFTKFTYVQDDNSLIIHFDFFDYRFGPLNEKGYLKWCNFFYSEDGVNFNHLMKAESDDQVIKEWSWITMSSKKAGEIIQFIGCHKPSDGKIWSEKDSKVVVLVHDLILSGPPKVRKASMNVKWFLTKETNNVKYFKIIGFWKVKAPYIGDKIDQNYTLNIKPSMSNQMKDNPLVLNSEISDIVKVTREVDAIIVTGAKPGDPIQVYNIAGTEVNSVIANNTAVKINLIKNQVYVVTVGKASYKVTL